MVKIGTDLDGVIAFNSLNKADFKPFRLHEYYSNAKPTKLSKMRIDVIITGRKEYFRKLTENWLSLYGVKYQQLIMFPNKKRKNNQSLAEYKSQKIYELGITKFFEDDENIADYLRRECSGTEIILIENLR